MTRQGEWHVKAHDTHSASPSLRSTRTWETVQHLQPPRDQGFSGVRPWRELTDSRISVLSHTPAFLDPKNQEGELWPPSTFWKIIHSFIHPFTHLSTR